MATKLSNEELSNVTGGGCGDYKTTCHVGDHEVSGCEMWSATYIDPTTGKGSRQLMCKKCADARANNPNWNDFKFEYDLSNYKNNPKNEEYFKKKGIK